MCTILVSCFIYFFYFFFFFFHNKQNKVCSEYAKWEYMETLPFQFIVTSVCNHGEDFLIKVVVVICSRLTSLSIFF